MKLSDLAPILNESEDENKDVQKAPAPGELGELITVKQAAKIIGVSPSRVRQFIQDGRLSSKGPEVGQRDNLLNLQSVKKFAAKERERTGRPSESKED